MITTTGGGPTSLLGTANRARHVHFLGICGYAVSGAALMAQSVGYIVTGSDEDAYPPTTDTLTAAGILWVDHHDPANLELAGVPDLVVVGNQVRPGNAEWAAAIARELPVSSEMEFYLELTRDRLRIAVCGTHGKTTTASMVAHMLHTAGLDPGFRLGTTSRDLGGTARLGTGPFVVEGDEYTTAPWDTRPKFLHVHPRIACVTRLELDHPDVYPDLDSYRAPFLEFVRTMPPDGLLAVCADDPECEALRGVSSCRTVTYGHADGADVRIVHDDADATSGGARRLRVVASEGLGWTSFVSDTGLLGAHMLANATAAVILAVAAGASLDACRVALATFRGASRRFEVLGAPGGVTVVDDYAHHPTEVAATVAAARLRAGRAGRVIALHVPHTYSRTLALLDEYGVAFAGADVVLIGPIEPARERHLEGTVSAADVVARVRRRITEAFEIPDPDTAVERVVALARPGDVVLCMSVRGFDGVAARIVSTLETVSAGDGGA